MILVLPYNNKYISIFYSLEIINSITIQKTPHTSKYIEYSTSYIFRKIINRIHILFVISIAYTFIIIIDFLYDNLLFYFIALNYLSFNFFMFTSFILFNVQK